MLSMFIPLVIRRLDDCRRCFPVYHKYALAAHIPLLTITLVPDRNSDLQVLEQAFLAILEHAPNMFCCPSTRLPSRLVEANAELAQITSTSDGTGQAVGAAF